MDSEKRSDDRLLTMIAVARFLGVHPRTVRAFVRSGELEGRLIGRTWRFRRSDVDRFVENRPKSWDGPGVKRGNAFVQHRNSDAQRDASGSPQIGKGGDHLELQSKAVR